MVTPRSRKCAVMACAIFSLVLMFCSLCTAEVFRDDFDDNATDSVHWIVSSSGGPELAETNQRIEVAIPGSSSGPIFSATLRTRFLLRGNFDVQVDYQLLQWPYSNGVRTSLKADFPSNVERTSFGAGEYPELPREVYYTYFADDLQGVVETGDAGGTLRLVRSGDISTGYFRAEGEWVLIHSGPGGTGDVAIEITSYSGDWAFVGDSVGVAFDNFIINEGELIPVHTEPITWGSIKALYR